jgi:hypothetical protein
LSPCPNTKSQRAYYARAHAQRTMLPKAACQIPDARRGVRNRSYGGFVWCSVKSCDIQRRITYVAALGWILEQLLVQHYNQVESAASSKSAQHHNQADSCRSRRSTKVGAYAARFRARLAASSILRAVLSAGKSFALEGSRSRRTRLSGLAGVSSARDGGRPRASLGTMLGACCFRILPS